MTFIQAGPERSEARLLAEPGFNEGGQMRPAGPSVAGRMAQFVNYQAQTRTRLTYMLPQSSKRLIFLTKQ
jgi:hypothetical protein